MDFADFEAELATRDGSTREWSAAQKAIFADVATGRGHTVVLARAGSGKSTTVEEAVRRIPDGKTAAVVAFGKEIANEMKGRLSDLSNVDVLTTHSYGLRQLKSKSNGGGQVAVNFDRVWSKVNATFARRTQIDNLAVSKSATVKLVGLAKNYAAAPQLQGAWSLNSPENKRVLELFDRIAARHGLDFYAGETDYPSVDVPAVAFAIALQVLAECLNEPHEVDFDDMIWIPAVLPSVRTWKYDLVFVDETQDLNPAQLALIKRMVKPGGRIIAVGDDRQAIYGFRGAAEDAVGELVAGLNAKVLPLSTTYRCGKSIVAIAKTIVPDYEAGPNNPVGIVRDLPLPELVGQLRPGDFVVSRANAPLVKILLGLFREGRRAKMLGKDLGAQLAQLVQKSRKLSIDDFLEWLESWVIKTTGRRIARKPDADVSDLTDIRETFAALCEDCDTIADLNRKLGELFTDDGQGAGSRVTLASTHKAKGLEAERVFVLKSTYRFNNIEEQNLLYVAVTRAKSELVLVIDPNAAKPRGRRRWSAKTQEQLDSIELGMALVDPAKYGHDEDASTGCVELPLPTPANTLRDHLRNSMLTSAIARTGIQGLDSYGEDEDG